MRLFIAFDIPDDIKEEIWHLEGSLKTRSRGIRITPKENMHITVKFMGEQPDFAIARIKELMEGFSERQIPFDIHLNKAGVFKSLRNPTVLWLGQRNEAFEDFSETVNDMLDVFRRADNKPFCHLTVGRMRGVKADEAVELIKICDEFLTKRQPRFRVGSVSLYESKLYRKGAVYNKIAEFNLKGV
ncbi:RNA 2',3'-cyclic phosphodiesterase [Hippea sp. KM1]|uniref:RNA 2',3'-cyclic phosphodiesterase n=1 Tax=Hippea sp. KM1 TaxID=944481 RepID=UPI00046C9B9F|nr:RNA 2',3'-cyclic phosphodiesterase [Hippea sp. KM1]